MRRSASVVHAEVLSQKRMARVDHADGGGIYCSVTYYWQIRVLDVLHGTADVGANYRVILFRAELDETDILKFGKGAKCIFFLEAYRLRQHREDPTHQPADNWFGVQPYAKSIAAGVKQLSKAKETARQPAERDK